VPLQGKAGKGKDLCKTTVVIGSPIQCYLPDLRHALSNPAAFQNEDVSGSS
jgi:hypothetical protein